MKINMDPDKIEQIKARMARDEEIKNVVSCESIQEYRPYQDILSGITDIAAVYDALDDASNADEHQPHYLVCGEAAQAANKAMAAIIDFWSAARMAHLQLLLAQKNPTKYSGPNPLNFGRRAGRK